MELIVHDTGSGSGTQIIGGIASDGRSLYTLRSFYDTILEPDQSAAYIRQTSMNGQQIIRTIYLEQGTGAGARLRSVGGMLFYRNKLIYYAAVSGYGAVVTSASDPTTVLKNISADITSAAGTSFFTGIEYYNNKFWLCFGTQRTVRVFNKDLTTQVAVYDFTTELPNAASRINSVTFTGKQAWVAFYDADQPAGSQNGVAQIDFSNLTLINRIYFTVPIYAVLYSHRAGFYVTASTNQQATLSTASF